MVSCSEDGTVRLWNLATFTNVVCYKGHMNPVWSVSFSPLGYYFATASHDRTARLWSTDHIYPLRLFAGHLSDVDVVKFHPNTNYIAIGSTDKSCRLWDVTTGECVRVFEGHTGTVHALAFSEDGKYLASGGDDCNVLLWNLGSGKQIAVLTGHRDVIYTVSFSGDGALLASGSADKTLRLWAARDAIGHAEQEEEDVGIAGGAGRGGGLLATASVQRVVEWKGAQRIGSLERSLQSPRQSSQLCSRGGICCLLPVSSTQTPKVRVLAWLGVHCEARQCKAAMAVMVQVLSIIFFPPFFVLSLSLSSSSLLLSFFLPKI